MFKRVYLQIAGMLMVSTILLMLFFGGIVYWELHLRLQQDGQASLRTEVGEIRDGMQLFHGDGRAVRRFALSDDKGQSVFFVVYTDGRLRYTSLTLPLSIRQLAQQPVQDDEFRVFHIDDKPYRLLRVSYVQNDDIVHLAVFQLISQESSMLRHVRNLMLLFGGVGLILALAFNLVLAERALRPARKTWAAHQRMMVELSHELQTPLATISAILSNQPLRAPVRSQLEGEIAHASEMVKDILYLSRLRSRLPHQPEQPIAVSDATEEVADRFKVLAEKHQIGLQGKAEPGLYVETTSERWDRLVSTQFKNVIDHAAPTSDATWSLLSKGDMVVLQIKNAPKTGDLFGQTAGAAAGEGAGSQGNGSHAGGLRPQNPRKTLPQATATGVHGFGLTITKHLLQQMEGTFDISYENGWVVVTITVPRLRTP